MAESSNDNAPPVRREPDAHGQAALLLIESVLHGLVEAKVFTVDQAMALVDVAAEVKADIGVDLGDSPATLQRSLTLLAAISASLASDIRPDR